MTNGILKAKALAATYFYPTPKPKQISPTRAERILATVYLTAKKKK